MSKRGAVYNLKRDVRKASDPHFQLHLFSAAPLPKTATNLHFFSPVRNQLNLGSCSAFSSAGGAAEMLENKSVLLNILASVEPLHLGSKFLQFSTLFQYQNTLILEGDFGQDNGASISDALQALAVYGAVPEQMWPYDISKFGTKAPSSVYKEAAKHKIKTFGRCDSLIAIKTAVAHGYPVVFGMMVYESFESDAVAKTGMVPLPNLATEQCLGGHAVCIVGYDETGFWVRNSWGPEWGHAGYFHLPYAFFDKLNQDDGLTMDPWFIAA